MCALNVVFEAGPFTAVEYCFAISTNNKRLSALLNDVFAHCATLADRPDEVLHIEVGSMNTTLTTDAGPRTLGTNTVVQAVVSHVNVAAAQRRRDDLAVLHAGAVVGEGGALVLPGRSGSGKSTLVASLLQHGWGYLADELAAVGAQASVTGYPKAITLKEGSRATLDWPTVEGEESAYLSATSYVEPESFGSVAPSKPTRAHSIVFPSFATGDGRESRRLSPGEALAQLTECAYLPLSSEAFGALAHLAATTPSWSMRYSTSADACTWVCQDFCVTA